MPSSKNENRAAALAPKPAQWQVGTRDKSVSVSIAHIRKRYGSFVALDDISLDIRSGEFLTLLGPSGSGKTTLLMTLAGFSRPESGSVTFDGEEVIAMPPHKRGVGMVFQSYALFPHFNVFENVAYSLKLRRLSKSDIAERVNRALDLVQLSGFGGRLVTQLSGGQCQRVAIARAIVFEPRVLLMDEPLSALDKKLREQMQVELRKLHDKLGMTTVYVTHDQREALTMSDRIAVMDHARICQVGSPQEIYYRPNTRFVADFIGESTVLPVDCSDGRVTFQGVELKVDRDQHIPNGRSSVMFRPESVRVAGAGKASCSNVLSGTIQDIIFQGETTVVQVALDNSKHRVLLRQTSESVARSLDGKASGDKLAVAIDPDSTVLVSD